ncbi:hypothetical protein N7516_005844, partial [Penicillium verrucosum]|uniref:uncharacterized protein n=1 Tax=Penicillium verrucosum TaxID=60171 RepID=UPI00254520F9
LSEHIYRFTDHKIREGLGPSFAARKFTCYIENGSGAIQATKLPGHAEIASYVAPQLLTLRKDTQGNDGLILGGYIDYLVWATVPSKPITKEEFWRLHPSLPKTIREKFMVLYSYSNQEQVDSGITGLRSALLAYEGPFTTLIRRLSASQPDNQVKWNDIVYALYGLIQVPAV